jgi:hypothetical protein
MQAAIRTFTEHAKSHRLRVAVIGGLTRATHLWTRAGDELGVSLEHHDGNTHGGRLGAIDSAVRRADVVVIITEPNSHGGVAAARRAAVAAHRPHVLVKRLRPNSLAAAIEDVLAIARTREATP